MPLLQRDRYNTLYTRLHCPLQLKCTSASSMAGELFICGLLKALVPREGIFQASPAVPCTTHLQTCRAQCMLVMCTEVIRAGWTGLSNEVCLQGTERSAVLAPARHWDCYVAQTGSAACMTLPTRCSASSPADSSPAGPSAAQQVLCLSETVRSTALQ